MVLVQRLQRCVVAKRALSLAWHIWDDKGDDGISVLASETLDVEMRSLNGVSGFSLRREAIVPALLQVRCSMPICDISIVSQYSDEEEGDDHSTLGSGIVVVGVCVLSMA